jgi:ribose transport system substrate-binding protein
MFASFARIGAPAIGFSLALLGTSALAQAPQMVSGPGYEPGCFAPASADVKYFKFTEKKPPYRIALANGFVGNTWRIQMIQTAKAFADQPDIKPLVKELKVVSTGTDVAAQVAAIDNFINSGYDAIVTIATNPSAFTPVIRRANKAGIPLVPFDNVVDSTEVVMVNEDQKEMGRRMGQWLLKNISGKSGKLLEIRGVPGNSVDRDRHLGFREVVEAPGNKFEVIEVVGMWDDGTAQKAAADAIAVHKKFDGIYTQGGSTGTVRALIDTKHPFIPVSGEAENGFRKLCAQYAKDGLKCASAGQTPALVAIAIKAAVEALQGKVIPQNISVPIPYVEDPNFKDGENFYSNLSDNFFVANAFPPCKVNFSATEIMGRSEANN